MGKSIEWDVREWTIWERATEEEWGWEWESGWIGGQAVLMVV
jgi:hypothetical protein